MSIKTFIINKGDGSFSSVTGETSDPGFMSYLNGKAYFEKKEDEPLVEDDPLGHFNSAYEILNGKVVVNMEKAKQGYLEFLKECRTSKLEDLDIEQIRALGKLDFDKIKEIEVTKASLRELPELIDWDSIETIYDLMHVFPPILQ
jgi:hypothetical protein